MSFDKTTLAVRTADGRNVTTLEDFTFTDKDGTRYTVPAGTTSDGASTPGVLWSLIPPFGAHWLAAVLHDHLYRNTGHPKALCDNLLYNAMISLGVSKQEAGVIYDGVKLGGLWAFREDRQQQHTAASAE